MKKKLKAVLFDMDGVLFDSMPYHSEAWHKVMKSHGLTLSREEAYMHEGRTGASTINIVFQRELGREATQEEIESIYQEKSVLFNSYPEAKPMPGAWELLQKVKKDGLIPMVVTGSGQLSLLERLEHHYPGMFHKELMVTAFDVKYGKPNPEPYLMALKKGGIKRHISELKLQVMKGDLHKAEDVERVMMDMLASFKTRLMNIPSKVAPALENRDAAYIKDRLTKEVLEVLNELKDYNPKDFYSDEYVEGEEDED